MADSDKMKWGTLNAWAMSDEETESDSGDRVFRTLPWRSADVTDLIKRCDAALGVVRKYGQPSIRSPNEKCLNFTSILTEE